MFLIVFAFIVIALFIFYNANFINLKPNGLGCKTLSHQNFDLLLERPMEILLRYINLPFDYAYGSGLSNFFDVY